MGFFDRISEGLRSSRDKFKESMNVLLDRGPDLDEGFWEELEETLILSDVGGPAALDIVERLRDQATRRALPDAYAVLDLLNDEISATFTPGGDEILGGEPAVVLFVGINGTGKTTTVGKIAKEQTDRGRAVILGSADTFRAAAIEQLEVWARRADVEMVTRERGSDPASVCFDTLERAEADGCDLVLIDTAGRLHTSADLMRELEKVVNVVRKRSTLPVYTVLVIDATTGQNGLQQAQEFNRALDLDALIVTKLDGSAKGGIALAVSHELGLPIIKVGVGEGIDDLRDFDAHDFASALIGDFDERYDDEDAYEGENVKEAAITAGERRRDVIEGARANVERAAAQAQAQAPVVAAEDVADAEVEASAAGTVDAEGAGAAAQAGESAEVAEVAPAGEPAAEAAGTWPDAEEAVDEALGPDQEPLEGVAPDEEQRIEDAPEAESEADAVQEADQETDAQEAADEQKPPKKKHFWERWF
ncbi:signal recognition particle-docking protein FtsY [Xiamenia xianingshaonis]|uniref:signal recognition particle-docking protein FtsY n=1 Tax=Xiamenia xianingshaonis TaxID=2682776 RepID=UPI0021BD910F|nr:signal recognition particle-docking protein FtsY [Xiamenia xianingshaonis]